MNARKYLREASVFLFAALMVLPASAVLANKNVQQSAAPIPKPQASSGIT